MSIINIPGQLRQDKDFITLVLSNHEETMWIMNYYLVNAVYNRFVDRYNVIVAVFGEVISE